MAAKLPKAIADMQLTAVRTLTSILSAPTLSSTVSGSTATLSWTVPAPTGQSVVAGYRLYKAPAVSGPFVLVATTTATSLPDPIAGTQFYRVEAFDQYQTGISSTVISCAPVTQGAIKWAAGHYADYDTVVSTGNGLAAIQFELDLMKPYDNCLGYMIAPTWGNLQQANGVYTFANLDSIVNYLTNRSGANFNRPKYYWISVVAGSFTKSHPGSAATFNPNDVSILPQYLMNNVGAYGAAAYRVGGVTTTTSNSGWWGGDGNGNTYGAALWRPAVSEEWIQLHEAIAAHYESDPYFMGVFHGENSFYQGTGSTNGDGSYNDITFQTNNKTWMQRCTVAMPTSNVAFSNTYLKFQNNTEDLTEWMMTTNTLAHPVLMGQTDTFGASYNGGAGHNSWGMAAYVGNVAGIPDFRSKGLCICEIQAPDIGFFKNTGGWQRADILNSLNNHEQAAFALWAIVPRNTATVSQQTALVPANWFNGSNGSDGLGAFINDPANKLIDTNYPASYPTQTLPAPTNVQMVQQGGPSNSLTNSLKISWTAVPGAVSYKIYRNSVLLASGITATNYTDGSATNAVVLTYDAPATAYYYQVSAVSAGAIEGTKSTQYACYEYQNGSSTCGQSIFNY